MIREGAIPLRFIAPYTLSHYELWWPLMSNRSRYAGFFALICLAPADASHAATLEFQGVVFRSTVSTEFEPIMVGDQVTGIIRYSATEAPLTVSGEPLSVDGEAHYFALDPGSSLSMSVRSTRVTSVGQFSAAVIDQELSGGLREKSVVFSDGLFIDLDGGTFLADGDELQGTIAIGFDGQRTADAADYTLPTEAAELPDDRRSGVIQLLTASQGVVGEIAFSIDAIVVVPEPASLYSVIVVAAFIGRRRNGHLWL